MGQLFNELKQDIQYQHGMNARDAINLKLPSKSPCLATSELLIEL